MTSTSSHSHVGIGSVALLPGEACLDYAIFEWVHRGDRLPDNTVTDVRLVMRRSKDRKYPGGSCYQRERQYHGCGVIGSLYYRQASGAASYARLPNLSKFQQVFTVLLDGTLKAGDCGSAVVDESSGNLYGHIVYGSAASSVAYIIPAIEVFADISARLGSAVSLVPVPALTTKVFPEPIHLTAFASDRYFEKLRQASASSSTTAPNSREIELSRPQDNPFILPPRNAFRTHSQRSSSLIAS